MWYATRYRDRMAAEDVVYFWMGGGPEVRGIYGWGVLTSAAYLKKDWDSYGVDVVIRVRFSRPLLAQDLKDDGIFSQLLIFRQPQATNFLLSAEEADALARAVSMAGEFSPPKS